MGNETLHACLTAAGLGRVASELVRLSMPSIRMDCRRVADQAALPVASSRLGGRPDLRSGQSWPDWQGSPMAFVAQVNLAEVAAHDEEGHLPHTGLLSFFCAIDDSAAGVMLGESAPSSWMVSHFDGDLGTVVRLPVPPELPEHLDFPSCQVAFSREPTLPDFESREILGLGLSEPERHAYTAVQFDSSAMNHHLLGYPLRFERSPFISGYVKAQGIPHPYMIDLSRLPEEQRQKYQDLQQRGPELLRDLQHKAEEQWRLLLQVFSNEEAQMDWGGGGVLHFCIPKDALSRREFDRVWAEMQFV